MSMVFRKSGDATLAIDLGADAVRIVVVRSRRGRVTMNSFADQSLPAGPSATLPERQLEALGQLLATQRIRTRRAVAALPTSMVLTRTVALDRTKGQTAEEQILWTLQNCLPFDPKDLVFDYWNIGDGLHTRAQDVMVVATQISVVEKYLKGFDRLHLTCVHLDVAPCAIGTLIAHSAARGETPVGTIALSHNIGFFAIADRGKILFWRPFELETVAGPGGGESAGIQGNLTRIGDEISKCVSHMIGQVQLEGLGEMLLFGDGSNDLVVNEYLKNRFHVPVRSPSPFDAVSTDIAEGSAGTNIGHEIATHYCTAMGLALQQVAGGQGHG